MIGIDKVLQLFDDTYNEQSLKVNEYAIRFITEDGRVRTMRCKKRLKAPKQGLQKPTSERGKMKYNLKRNGNMLVEDVETNEPRTIKPAMLFEIKTEKGWEAIYH
ncbi:MAG: hypothetical protein O9302_00335 [Cyclobacteriaceae bacterium]|jgi:hypothetical protein|nr:hypothetical protein [Cytophagales bacterium]MCZ8326478.1 hypothetical protein [Cyclobacteriaceae bacterium]